jgi:hypothetical protein
MCVVRGAAAPYDAEMSQSTMGLVDELAEQFPELALPAPGLRLPHERSERGTT